MRFGWSKKTIIWVIYIWQILLFVRLMNDKYFIKCREDILGCLGKRPGDKWLDREIQDLSDKIYEKSKIRLSVNTLKRILGLIKYEGNPSMSTKDALAQYLDYMNWEDFLIKNFSISLIDYEKYLKSNVNDDYKKVRKGLNAKVIIVAILLIVGLGVFFLLQNTHKTISL